jgi:hypothetical protein
VLVDITIHLDIQPEEHMHFQNQRAAQVVSPVRHQRRRHELDILQGELRRLKPPTFDGEHRKGEDVEAWLLGMRKYFQLHNYSSNMEAKIPYIIFRGKLPCGGTS